MSGRRDTIVDWGKDVSRTVDYLESRPDIDSENISLVGLSMGGIYVPIFGALEPRFKSLVIIGGGLHDGMQDYPVVYRGIAPDTFTDDVDVVVEGWLGKDGTFHATTLLANAVRIAGSGPMLSLKRIE